MTLLERWRRWWSWPVIEVEPLSADQFMAAVSTARVSAAQSRAEMVRAALADRSSQTLAVRPRPGEVLIVLDGEILHAELACYVAPEPTGYFGPAGRA